MVCYYDISIMKKLGFILLVTVMLLVINGLIHSIYDLWQKQDLLTSAQKELDAQKLKNSKLKGELTYVQSQQFIDEEARNKLFLAKPGEQQILLPDSSVSNKEVDRKTLPNWQQWLKLFF
jgi:cell division protein FtsB